MRRNATWISMRIIEPICHSICSRSLHGDKEMTIGLSKMIKKNSRRRGTEPAVRGTSGRSFRSLYKINLSPKMHRSPTLRLVVLDEAFSKMDAEKWQAVSH